MEQAAISVPADTVMDRVPISKLVLYFLRLGTIGFGGPVALVGYMQRDLVDERRWVSKEDYTEGLAFAQLAPGPLAAQLAMYLGWVRGGFWGATLTGIAFIWPSFFMVLALSALYVRYGGLPWMQSVFYGIAAAVIAIIGLSAYKLVRKVMGKDMLLWVLFAVSAIATAWTRSEIIWLFVLSGFIVLMGKALPCRMSKTAVPVVAPWAAWLLTGLHGPAPLSLLWRLLLFFTEAGAFVFGSGLAIVPFLYGGVVAHSHWLTERQFLDAVAVAMITPGPVVITVGFIGYLVAGPLGATVAALGVFLPVYLFVVLVAPYFRRFANYPHVKAFVAGVVAAATGAITGAVFILGRQSIIDLPTALIAIATLFLLLKVKKVPEPLLIVAAGLIGLLVRGGH